MEVTASNYFMSEWDFLAEPFHGSNWFMMIFISLFFVIRLSLAPLLAYVVYYALDDTDQGKLVA